MFSCRGKVCTNKPNSSIIAVDRLKLKEAGAKRRNEAHFISKLTDCDGETDSSLDFGRDCGYISPAKHAELASLSAEIGKMLSGMIKKAGSFAIPDRTAGILICDVR